MSAVAAKAQSSVVVRPSTPVIGAEIEGVDLSKPLSPAEVDDIHQALLQWKVLFFRDQEISDEQQLAFGRYFGKLTPAHPRAGPAASAGDLGTRRRRLYAALPARPVHPTAKPSRDIRAGTSTSPSSQSQQIFHPARHQIPPMAATRWEQHGSRL